MNSNVRMNVLLSCYRNDLINTVALAR
jgi:hypothetical protein